MRIQSKQRLLGAIILLVLIGLAIPFLFQKSKPAVEEEFGFVTLEAPINEQASEMAPPSIPSEEMSIQTVAALETLPAKDVAQVEVNPIVAEVVETVKKEPHSTKQVIVEKTTPAPSTAFEKQLLKEWVVQLGTFSKHENAQQLVRKLRQKGFDAYHRQFTNSAGKSFTHVLVGPEASRSKLVKLKAVLQTQFKMNGMIKRYKSV